MVFRLLGPFGTILPLVLKPKTANNVGRIIEIETMQW